jgi:hypothetical protein
MHPTYRHLPCAVVVLVGGSGCDALGGGIAGATAAPAPPSVRAVTTTPVRDAIYVVDQSSKERSGAYDGLRTMTVADEVSITVYLARDCAPLSCAYVDVSGRTFDRDRLKVDCPTGRLFSIETKDGPSPAPGKHPARLGLIGLAEDADTVLTGEGSVEISESAGDEIAGTVSFAAGADKAHGAFRATMCRSRS